VAGPAALAGWWERIPAVLPECAVVVDAEAGSASLGAALAAADAVVVVLRSSPGLRAVLAAARAWTEPPRRARLRFLLNAFDSRRPADRADRAVLEASLGAALLPAVIHEDAALLDLPAGASLAEHAPASQALRDIAETADALFGAAGQGGGLAGQLHPDGRGRREVLTEVGTRAASSKDVAGSILEQRGDEPGLRR
jgi:hypothetical protein